MMFSLRQEMLYANDQAHRLIKDIEEIDRTDTRPSITTLPATLMSLCHDLITHLGPHSCHARWPGLQIERRLVAKTATILARGMGLPNLRKPLHSRLLLLLEAVTDGSSASPVPAEDPHPALTDREMSVMRGVAAGLTNRQIGEGLRLREGTVKEYLKRVRLKVGRISQGSLRARLSQMPLGQAVSHALGQTLTHDHATTKVRKTVSSR